MSWIVTLLLALFFMVYAYGAAQFKNKTSKQEIQLKRELLAYFRLQDSHINKISQRAKGRTWNTFISKQDRARMSINDSIENLKSLNGAMKHLAVD